MRVFLSAGEASGDAYGAEIVYRLLAQGAFSSHRLAGDVVNYMTAQNMAAKSGQTGAHAALMSAAQQIQDFYYGPSQGRSTAFARLFQGATGTVGPVSKETLIGEIAHDLDDKLVDSKRLLSESLFAVGGPRLKEAGAAMVADSSGWGALGIIEAIKVGFGALHGYDDARRRLTKEEAGLFLPIDFGYMNVKLAKRAKENGWKVLYFSPPGSWRRDKQGANLPTVTDAIVTPFPWSAEILNNSGANAHYFGHPLKQMVGQVDDSEHRDGIAVLPGSRGHEIANNMAVIMPVLDSYAGPVRFAVASTVRTEDLQRLWASLGGGEAEFRRDTYGVLKESRAALVCSGTATLEAALCNCPSVVVYRGSKLMEWEVRVRKPKFEFLALPNILLRRLVVPELVLWECTPTSVRNALEPLLEDGPERQAQLDAFAELSESLGPSDCLDRTVELAMEMMYGSAP